MSDNEQFTSRQSLQLDRIRNIGNDMPIQNVNSFNEITKASTNNGALPWLKAEYGSNGATIMRIDYPALAATIIDAEGYTRSGGRIVDRQGNVCTRKDINAAATKQIRAVNLVDINEKAANIRKLVYDEIEAALPVIAEPIVLQTLDNIVAQPHDFLVRPYLPRKYITLLQGDSSSGKSSVFSLIAAAVSTGKDIAGISVEAGKVLILSEDLTQDIMVRIRDCGGDLAKVTVIDCATIVDLQSKVFENAVAQVMPSLIIIDPIQKYMGLHDMNMSQDVRLLTNHINYIAAKYNCSVMMVMHESKAGRKQMDKLYSSTGSNDFVNSARSLLAIAADPADRNIRYMMHIKSNISKEGRTLKYTIKSSPAGDDYVGHAQPVALVDFTTADLYKAQREQDRKSNMEDLGMNALTDMYTVTILSLSDANQKSLFISYQDFVAACIKINGYHDRSTQGKAIGSYINKYLAHDIFTKFGVKVLPAGQKYQKPYKLAGEQIEPIAQGKASGFTIEKVR